MLGSKSSRVAPSVRSERACRRRLLPQRNSLSSFENILPAENPGLTLQARDRRSDRASMLPVAEASSIPVPTALRPAGEIKVRKRRENRSSTSSIGGAQHSTCSESDSSSLDLTLTRSSPPVIIEPDTPTLHRRKSSKNKVFSRVLGSIQASRSSPGLLPTRHGHSDGSIFRKLSLRRRPSLQARSVSSDLPVRPSTAS